MKDKLLRVGVIGLGHLGKHHVRIYNQLSPLEKSGLVQTILKKLRRRSPSITAPICQLTAVYDIEAEKTKEFSSLYDVNGCKSLDGMYDLVDAVSIAAPTVNHYEIAKEFLSRGISVLIEKPITRTVEEADELIKLSKAKGAIIQVGHVERFNPVMVSAGELVCNPKFIEAHRLSSFPKRSIDIDVILDLMIHDIDLIISFVRSKVRESSAVGVPVLTGKIDIANARLEFESGCVANVTASRVSMKAMRKMRIFQPDRYLSLDYLKQEILCVDKKGEYHPEEKMDPKKLLSARQIVPKSHEPLFEELKSFIYSVKRGAKPVVSGEEGRNALEVAYKILESMNKPAK